MNNYKKIFEDLGISSGSALWYKQPAKVDVWTEALPIGNGRLGAMIFGGIASERIQLNEDSVWSGSYRDRINTSAKKELESIRSLLRDGKIKDAENLSRYALTGLPEFQRTYQTLGDLLITHHGISGKVTDYIRALSLDEAAATTSFVAGGYHYKQEVIASAPADVIAVRLTTDNPDGLSFDARVIRDRFYEHCGVVSEDTTYFNGNNGGAEGISLHCMMTGQANGGRLQAMGEYLIFHNTKEAVLFITAATSYRTEDTYARCEEILSNAKSKGYERIRKEHVADYQALESLVSLKLTDDEICLPTDERLTVVQKGGSDLGLTALYFRFGRYLLISSSRPGTLPVTLQGIWCNEFMPPWDSKYTININTQMNYWPADICNLSQCYEPLFRHIRRMHPRGIETANKMYGARGFVAHHNTDIWGDCAPQDTWIPASYWVMGAAWLCLHIWEHYEYTLDRDFLMQSYDLLKDACLFFVDFLIENEHGELIVTPTVSPENTYILPDGTEGTLCDGCVMDGQILEELFSGYINTCRILNRDFELAESIDVMRSKLPKTQVGKNGGIMEWLTERGEVEPGHRHMSHLFALFPGNGISPDKTPELAKAARKTLELRLSQGGGHTGWSRAWIINFWAKLGDGNEANHHLKELLRHSTLSNLFDDHPPFQIDGNFGATAAIAHMLLQSDANTVYLLKALPDEWADGSVTGLCAKGGLVVDISWEKGSLTKATIFAKNDYEGTVVYGDKVSPIKLSKGETMSFCE